MSPEELKEIIESYKKQGLTDKDLAEIFLTMCARQEIDVEDLKTLLAAVGFNLDSTAEKVLRDNPESLGFKKPKNKRKK